VHERQAEAADRRGAWLIAKGHRDKAAEARAAAQKADQVAGILAGLLEDRQEHDELTADSKRRVAVAAMTELQRRGLEKDSATLKSAEPQAFDYGTEPEADGSQSERQVRDMLGLSAAKVSEPVGERVTRLTAIALAARSKIDEIRSMAQPEEDDDVHPSEAWGRYLARERQPVLQKAPEPLPVAGKVTEHLACFCC